MVSFAERLRTYVVVSQKIVKGEKISRNDYDSSLLSDIESLATRMYTGFFTPYEPQAIFMQEGWGQNEIVLMGKSNIHPLARNSCEEAEFLNGGIGQYAVYGMNTDTRYDVVYDSAVYSRKNQYPHVLLKSDFVALAQVTDDILLRVNHSNPSSLPPIIIQGKEFWGGLFADNNFDYSSLGIIFTSNEEETKKALSDRVTDKDVVTSLFPTPSPFRGELTNVFATTDHIKFDQGQVAQIQYPGRMEVAHGVTGPYRIPEENEKSYPGNAQGKLCNIMEIALERGLQDTNDVQYNLMVHDGGLAFYLMNEQGERYTMIFTDKEFFPYSADVMNRLLSGPGVELAELYKSAPNLDVVIEAVFQKIDDVCSKDARFKPSDLKVNDTVVQMAIPLAKFRLLYDKYELDYPKKSRHELCEMISLRHAVQVFDAISPKLLRRPQYDSVPLVTDTTHFLTYSSEEKSRAQFPEWIEDSPTVKTFQMMMQQLGVQKENAFEDNIYQLHRPPKIAIPQMLFGAQFSQDGTTEALKKILNDQYKIKWKKGAEYWRKAVVSYPNPQKDFASAGLAHRKNVRDILAEHDFLYIPMGFEPATPDQWLQSMLLFSSAIVQRQVFKPGAPRIVLERGKFADEVIAMYKSLKNMGLIGQQFDHLIKLSDSSNDSAHYISAMAHLIPRKAVSYKSTPLRPEVMEPQNLTATAYCSASNKNAMWLPDARRIGSELATHNIDLKLGGGKDGMMQAVADGYLEKLAERVSKGEHPTCKLHLIQCTATQTIEGDYKLPDEYAHLTSYIDRRCHDSIEERRFDLQQSHIPLVLAGGIGTFEEIMCELIAVSIGERRAEKFTLYILSQSAPQPDGKIASVYDYLNAFADKASVSHGRIKICNTVEEIKSVIGIAHKNYCASKILSTSSETSLGFVPKVA